MTTVVTSSGQLDSSQTPKKRVQISDGASGTTLDLSEHKGLLGGLTPGGLEFPSTAELMHKCMSLNPFEAKFAEANRRISAGVLEANGLVAAPVNLPSTATGSAAPTLKLSTTLSQSPGIFSNISILTTDMDPSENLKTADISKLLQQACSDVGQAPRTADVLNTVLDMHGDRLHTINYLNKDLSSIFSSLTPSGSAPNSAGVLGLVTSAAAAVLPTTSGGLLSIPKIAGISPNHSPRQTNTLTNLSESTKESRQPKQTSPIRVPEVSLLSGLNADANWDPRDVKPSLSQLEKPLRGYFDSDGVGAMAAGSMPTVAIPGGSLMSFDKGEDSPTPSSRGRGRGRAAATTELPADERRYDETNCNGQDSRLRMTILERNKAAAVRYRKRKKEEHDDMVSRVHGLEQEKNNFATQNQVLRQELERVTALLREREVRCVCLKGRLPLSTDHGSDSPGDVDILSPQHGMYIPQAQQLINGLGMNNGLGLKRPKM